MTPLSGLAAGGCKSFKKFKSLKSRLSPRNFFEQPANRFFSTLPAKKPNRSTADQPCSNLFLFVKRIDETAFDDFLYDRAVDEFEAFRRQAVLLSEDLIDSC
jgi:hypothetical protein